MTVGAGPTRSSRRVRQTALVYVVIGVLQRSLGLLLLPFVTRVLTPEEYGQISVVVTSLTLVGVVLAAAIEVPLFRSVARGSPDAERVMRWSRRYLVWYLPGVCLMVAVPTLLVGGLQATDMRTLWAVELASVGLVASFTYYALPVLRAADRLLLYFVLAMTWMVVLVGTKILFLGWLLPGPVGWVASDLVASTVGWLFVVGVAGKVRLPPGGDREADAALRTRRGFIRACLTLVPHRLSFWALTTLSRPALLLVATVREVGLYSFAVSIAAASMMVVAELNRSVLLEYSRESFPAPTEITRTIVRVQVIAALAVPMAVALALGFAGDLLVGPDFLTAIPLVGALLVGQLCYGIYLIPMNYLVQTAGKYTWSSLASVLGAAVILVAILLGGWLNSLPLVALGTAAGYLAMMVSAFVLVRIASLDIRWDACVPSRTLLALLVSGFAAGVAALVFYDGARFVFLTASALAMAGSAAVIARQGLPAGRRPMLLGGPLHWRRK